MYQGDVGMTGLSRSPMKLLLSVLATLTCGALLFAGCTQRDNLIDRVLVDAANEINTTCPFTVDSETRLDNCAALPNKTLQYNYTLVNYSKEQLTEAQIEQMKDTLNTQIVNLIKSSSDMQTLKDYEVTFRYVYKSNDYYELFSITVKPQDYK